jgi:ferredoxin
MIIAEKKPIEEIIQEVKDFDRILILGCNECVTVCEAGGKKEVEVLASVLRMYFMNQGQEKTIGERTLERQCDHEYLEEIRNIVDDYDAVVSLACGVGVQFAAEKYQTMPLLPGSTPCVWGPTKTEDCGRNGARPAGPVCWPVPAASVRYPDVPNGS